MNKRCYRLIFSQTRGMLVAVSEIVSAHSCGGMATARGNAGVGVAWATLRPLTFAVLGALGMVSLTGAAQAQIIADPNAPGNQRPTVLQTANGVPQVNIQTPSAAGVSRNTYRQFDVGGGGAILNNSRTNAETKLGGWVQGNPWLATGSARVILNEVNSSSPSHLNGFVEVAGQRAEVIIANPAGISVNGGGFINASGVTLTTGTPILNSGALDAYRVERGTVAIEGLGLDAKTADHTRILARAVQLNAGIWAQDLQVTVGANHVPANAPNSPTPIAGTGSAPAFSLDSSALGGMYAGKITLVGTEAGVGVRNAGTLAAASGKLSLNVNGWLSNSGIVQAGGDVHIKTQQALTNSGTIRAQGHADVLAQGGLKQQSNGLLSAQGDMTLAATDAHAEITIEADSIVAAGLKQDGSYAAGGKLSISAGSQIALQGEAVAPGAMSLTSETLDLSKSKVSAGALTLAAPIAIDADQAHIGVTGALRATTSGALQTDGAQIAAGQLVLQAESLSNVGGELVQNGSDAATLNVTGTLNNTSATIASNAAMSITAGKIINKGGTLATTGTSGLTLDVTGVIDNSASGAIAAGGTLLLSADSGVDNSDGFVAANQALVLESASLNNTRGTLASVQGDVQVKVDTGIANTQGRIEAGADIALTANALNNGDGTIAAHQGLSIQLADQLDNAAGVLAAGGAMEVAAANVTNIGGSIASDGAMTLVVIDLTNQAGAIATTSAADLELTATGAIDNSTNGVIAAAGKLTVTAGKSVNNASGLLAANKSVSLSADTIDNNGGTISSIQQDVAINTTGAISNQTGRIEAAQEVTATAGSLDNSKGQVQAAGDITVAVGSGALANAAGLIRAAGTTSITAATLTNNNTRADDTGLEGAAVVLSADHFANAGGAVRGGTVSVSSSKTVDNSAGLISASKSVNLRDSVSVAGLLEITNTGGTVIAGKSTTVAATSLSGDGEILSLGDLSLTVSSDLVNSGQVAADGNLDLTSGGTLTNSGKLTAGGNLDLSAQHIDNRASGEIASTNTKLDAEGILTNRGLIDGIDTRIDAQTVNNLGPGLIYGTSLSIAAATLNNEAETVNGSTSAPVIAARERLDLGVQQLNNREGALIFSGKDIAIGGALDANRQATGAATAINNASATIEALTDLSVQAGSLTNTNLHFAMQEVLTSTTPVVSLLHGGVEYPESQIGTNFGSLRQYHDNAWWRVLLPSEAYPFDRFPANASSWAVPVLGSFQIAPRFQTFSIDFGIDGDRTEWTIDNYPPSHDIWERFDITPPLSTPAYMGPDCTMGFCNPTQQAAYEAHLAKVQAEQAATAKLDAAIAAYNATIDGRTLINWTVLDYNRTEYGPQVVSSAPGKITVGRNLAVATSGSAVNDKSQIIVGASASFTGAQLQNVAAIGETRTVKNGQSVYSWYFDDKSWNDDNRYYHFASYYAEQKGTVTLPVAVFQANGSSTTSGTAPGSPNLSTIGTTIRTAGAPATNAAGGQVGTTFTNTQTVLASAVPQPAGPQGAASGAGSNGIQEVASSLGTGSSNGALAQVVRTVPPVTQIPTSSLFHTHPDAPAGYVAESDARFTNYRNWLGSDYMLSALALDPATTQKRLGDGFFEQRLVREQVGQLTGRRFLGNYASDETQFRSLMDNGLTVAQSLQLRPGVALSAEQMAQLTSDIVWLVEQDVTLADGRTTRVLVPQVYVRVQPGDLDGTGTLIAAESINIAVNGDVVNSGTLAGRKLVQLSALNIDNLGGSVTGADAALFAQNDLNNTGGRIEGKNSVLAMAGRDINLSTTTQTTRHRSGAGGSLRTTLDRVAGLYVSGNNGTLTALAGRDLNLKAASIDSAGSAHLEAGRDIRSTTVTTESRDAIIWDSNNRLILGESEDVGSRITAQGNVAIVAGQDVTARAAGVVSEQGAVSVFAQRDVTLEAGTATHDFEEAHQIKSRGTFSKKTVTTIDRINQTQAVGSQVEGATVTVMAGRDATITGSHVLSDTATQISAANNLTIAAAEDSTTEYHFRDEKKSGLFGSGGASVTIGKQQQTNTQDHTETTAAGSVIGSVKGDVTLAAGKAYRQVGSDVVAPEGDIEIAAQQVEISEARQNSRTQTETKFKQSGLTVAISSPVLSAAQSVQQLSKASRNTDSGRAKALAGASSALAAKGAIDAVNKGQDGAAGADEQGGGINISISIGGSKSESKTVETTSTAAGSTLVAGGDIRITATGAGQQSDLTVQGSDIQAGQNIALTADDAITLQAARNDSTPHSTNSSKSGSIGVSFGTSGFLVNASASKGRGKASGNDVTWTNSHVEAGETLTIESGGDTTLKGAVASADQVKADIGGDLHIESLQDISHYTSRQKSAGGSISIGAGKIGGSIQASKSNVDSNYASVVEQSGIKARDGGYQVAVGGNTDLRGGVISSGSQAIEGAANTLTTGTLTVSDIQNHASADVRSSGISLGSDMLTQGKYGLAKGVVGNLLSNTSEFGSSSGVTRGAASAGQVEIRDENGQKLLTGMNAAETVTALNRDTGDAHAVAAKPDVETMRKSVEAERMIKEVAFKAMTVYTDDAYETLFKKEVKFYKVTCGADPQVCVNDPTKITLKAITEDEARRDGKVLAVNGILNDADRAGQLSYQNAPLDEEKLKPSQITLMHIAPSRTEMGEVLVAGYEKILAPTFGYSNADLEYAEVLQGRGNQETLSLGHSRGTIVQKNAFNIAAEAGYTNENLSVEGVGGAVHFSDYTQAASRITKEEFKENITYTYMSNDPVTVIAAGNPGDALAAVKELYNVWMYSNSAHSCYGTGAEGCATIANPIPGGPFPTNQRPESVITYRGGVLVGKEEK